MLTVPLVATVSTTRHPVLHTKQRIKSLFDFKISAKKTKMPRGTIAFTYQETERLIELVRQNACLFDPTLPGYRDAQLVSNSWSSIAKALGREEFDGKFVFRLFLL